MNCTSQYHLHFTDLEAPKLLSLFYQQDSIIFQFDEPVRQLKLKIAKEEYLSSNAFPVANHYLASSLFESYQSSTENPQKMTIYAEDNFGNLEEKELEIPRLNSNPVDLIFNKIRLKYTKKTPQLIELYSKEGGNTYGFCLNIFIRNQWHRISLPSISISPNSTLSFIFYYDKETEKIKLTGNKNNYHVTLSKRLPQNCGLITLTDYKEEIQDYFAYYNSKERTYEEYQKSSYYKELFYLIITENYKVTDIAGTTTKKVVLRKRNSTVIPKPYFIQTVP